MSIKVEKIYQELLELKLTLEFQDSPNPAYIQNKLIACHQANDKVEKYHTELRFEISKVERDLSIAQSSYESRERTILTSNERAMKYPSMGERKAFAASLLEDVTDDIRKLKLRLEEFSNLEKALALVIKNLNRLNNDIKSQQKLMDSQLTKLNAVTSNSDVSIDNFARKLGVLEEELNAEDLEVAKAEETIESDEIESNLESLSEEEPNKDSVPEDSLEEESNDSSALEDSQEETLNPLDDLLTSTNVKAKGSKKDSKKEAPQIIYSISEKGNPQEILEVDTDLSNSFLEDDSEELPLEDSPEESSDIEESFLDQGVGDIAPESNANVGAPPASLDDLEDSLEGLISGEGETDLLADISLEETPKPEKKEAPKKEAVKEAPKKEAVKEAPKKEAVKEAPKKEAAKEAPKKEAVKEAPKKEAAKSSDFSMDGDVDLDLLLS